MTAADRHARKQVLLTRIAFGREEMRRDMLRVQQAAHPSHLLRAVAGQSLAGALGRSPFGAAAAGDWLGAGMALLRRYRVAAALVGTAAPLLRGGGRWRRVLRIGVLAGAAWLGWRLVRDRQRPP
ncbi:MAG: hypothetical protein ABI702_05770 [Burkholderiales bacterium]